MAAVADEIQSLPHPHHKLISQNSGLCSVDSMFEPSHNFTVVQELITPAILGIDFLEQHNFCTSPVTVDFAESHLYPSIATFTPPPEMQCIIQAEEQR